MLQFVEFRWHHLSVSSTTFITHTQASTAYSFVRSPLSRFIWIYVAELPGNKKGCGSQLLRNPLVPLHVHFPETLKETRVYLRIHNSDTARLVKYLFLTAESFWDNWANTSAAYGGEAADWRAIHPSEQSSHGRVFLLVLEEVLLAFAG